jgi:hypothetical protein
MMVIVYYVMRSKNEVLCAMVGRLAAERSEADKPAKAHNSILYIEGEKCMIFPKVQFVARGRSPRATKHRGKNEHSLQKYIYYFFHGRE